MSRPSVPDGCPIDQSDPRSGLLRTSARPRSRGGRAGPGCPASAAARRAGRARGCAARRPRSPRPGRSGRRPVGAGLPRLAGGDDLVVRATDEVPPHDDLLAERLAGQDEDAGALVPRRQQERASVADPATRTRRRLHDTQLGRRNRRTGEVHRPTVHQHPDLELVRHRQGHRGARLEHDLDPEQRGLDPHRRARAPQRPDEHARLDPGRGLHRLRHVVLEPRLDRRGGRRQHDPQLRTVQHARAGGRHLRVRDAPSGRHEVDLARTDDGDGAEGVAVLDLAGEQPRDGREAAVRVRRDVHPAADRDVVGPVVVGEAPRPDERALLGRQGPPHRHRARPPERHLARSQRLHSLHHGSTLASRPSRRASRAGARVQGASSPGG